MRDTQKFLNWAQLAEKELQETKDKMEALLKDKARIDALLTMARKADDFWTLITKPGFAPEYDQVAMFDSREDIDKIMEEQ